MTTGALHEQHRRASARDVVSGGQAYVLGLLQWGVLAAVLFWPRASLLGAHLALTVFFLVSNGLRLTAAIVGRRPPRPDLGNCLPPGLPVYTILVALKDEAAMVPQLTRGLAQLHWPKSRLDIKFVCESDDEATIAALKAHARGPQYEIVLVPPHGPATKPKALQYALAGARGEFLTIYDAEDVPAPAQLLEAWTLFQKGDETLGCVQAPLAVANYRRNWLTALFALEYGGWFRGVVPILSRCRLPIPLGGTSNHFRTATLIAIGGWDPYNVTEDADVGFRLSMAGYRTQAAHFATIEAAPETLGVWMKQRSRWLKGWAQTWLVLLRQPLRLSACFGVSGSVMMQVIIGGMLISALAHPLMYLLVGGVLVQHWVGVAFDPLRSTLLAVDVFNILGSYLSFWLLGNQLTSVERQGIGWRRIPMVPLYWLAMSASAWTAIGELLWRPHHWSKTPHPARQDDTPDAADKNGSQQPG
nr:glycosyltransferase [Pseudohoeflea sp. DP4N28-3]